jgi:hypothetical protein
MTTKLEIGSMAPKKPQFEVSVKHVLSGKTMRYATDSADGISAFVDRNIKIVKHSSK